jgi:hypothetical protein
MREVGALHEEGAWELFDADGGGDDGGAGSAGYVIEDV